MSEQTFISPLKIDAMTITAASMEMQSGVASPDLDLTVTMTMGMAPLRSVASDDTDMFQTTVPLTVVGRLTDGDNAEKEQARVNVSGVITVSVPKASLPDGQDALELLRVNGVSILYGHIRSYVMGMTAATPLSGFMLPAIDPAAYVKLATSNEGAEQTPPSSHL